jgi:hypothetical protein
MVRTATRVVEKCAGHNHRVHDLLEKWQNASVKRCGHRVALTAEGKGESHMRKRDKESGNHKGGVRTWEVRYPGGRR